MAIYHFKVQVISRISETGNVRSTIAAAAYRSGELLRDYRDGTEKFYPRRVAPEAFLLCPENAPEWARNREQLWNTVEQFEKAYNAQLAREINIALPIELPKSEQTKLALEFCQKNFVDKGMVADIAIHRDKDENPHFHVMLTLRQIGLDGKFMPKCKKVYELDKNGNKIPLPSGDFKSHRENLTNWNDKETLKEWRKSWQDIANQYLEKNGFSERICCKSYSEQNIQLLPTVHEGPEVHKAILRNQETEIGNYNQQVKKYNDTIVKLDEYKRERAERDEQKILRCFTPEEKAQLVSAAKQLKFYVNNENLEKRLKELAKWEKSHFAKGGEFKQFERILTERQIIGDVKEVLYQEAARFCDKYYTGAILLPEEQLELVSRTIDKGNVLDNQEVNSLRLEVREKEFRDVTRYLLTNGNVFWLDAVQTINREEARAKNTEGLTVLASSVLKLDSAKGQYHIYQDKITAQTFIGHQSSKEEVMRLTDWMGIRESHAKLQGIIRGTEEVPVLRMGYNVEKVERLEQALCVMDKLYDECICQKYGDNIKLESLSIPQKEMMLHYEEYYGTRYNEAHVPAPVYSTNQKSDIINCLVNKDKATLQEKYPRFKDNNVYLNMFVLDCLGDDKLSIRDKDIISRYATGIEIPNGQGFEKAPSPHSLIASLFKGMIDTTRPLVSDRDSKMTNRIQNRRKRHKQQNMQQNQEII